MITLDTNSLIKEDIIILHQIGCARFPVYMVKKPQHRDYFALKVFPLINGNEPSQDYLQESKFCDLKHPHIIQHIHVQEKGKFLQNGKQIIVSSILMELAPYGDFQSLLTVTKVYFDDKLTRTYFRQLIEGLEYLHKSGVSHLDLKPENLLLSKDYKLKICDFDLSCKDGEKIHSVGTKYFRAPEIITQTCEDPKLADIFSSGIILFTLKSGGKLPQTEEVLFGENNLLDLMQNDQKKFWDIHIRIQKRRADYFSDSFKFLFHSMTNVDTKVRISISEIKKTKWYQGPIYNEREIKSVMKLYFR